MKIKKGDNVIVLTGKDKGKTGAVLETMADTDKVIVEGVQLVTKHQKNKRSRSQGQLIEKEMPIHVSNVALLEEKKPVRVGYKVEDGKKVRISRASGKTI